MTLKSTPLVIAYMAVALYALSATAPVVAAQDFASGLSRGEISARMRESARLNILLSEDNRKKEAIARFLKDCPTCMQVEGSSVTGRDFRTVGSIPTLTLVPDAAIKCPAAEPYYDTINRVCLSLMDIIKLGAK